MLEIRGQDGESCGCAEFCGDQVSAIKMLRLRVRFFYQDAPRAKGGNPQASPVVHDVYRAADAVANDFQFRLLVQSVEGEQQQDAARETFVGDVRENSRFANGQIGQRALEEGVRHEFSARLPGSALVSGIVVASLAGI
jgi:hypothetical protein